MARRPRLSYENVIATLALFLVLTGGAAWAASKINGKQIKKNSIPGNRIKQKSLTNNQIKKSTITNDRIKPGTIQRTALAAGALPGLIVADSSASNLPGAVTATPPGPTPVSLVGTTSFNPVPGKAYEMLTELTGNPINAPADICRPFVSIYVNSVSTTRLDVFSRDPSPGFDTRFPESSYTTSLLTESGTQFINAKVFGDQFCEPGTTLDRLRIVVVQLG